MDKFSAQDMAKFMKYVQSQHAAEAEIAKSAEVTTTEVADSSEPEMKSTARQTASDDEMINFKSDFLIEERVRSLASQEKFYEATSLCGSITHVDETDVGIKLLKAECYVQLGRESKAEKAIRDVENLLMKPPMFNVEDVLDLAKDYSDNSSYIRALLLLKIAFDVLMKNSSLSPDEKVDRGFRCMSKMDDVLDEIEGTRKILEETASTKAGVDVTKKFGSKMKSLVTSERARVLYLDYGVEAMEEMLKKIESIKSFDPETTTLKLARYANHINLHYKAFGQNAKAVKVLQFTTDRLEKQFGKNARQYGIYNMTLFNIGSDYFVSGKYKECEFYTMRALEAAQYELDFVSVERKQEGIKSIENALKIIRSKLKMA